MSYRTVSVARAILLAGSAAIFAIPAQAYAQDAEEVAAEANDQASEAAQESGEIVVTARRRAEALQDVPIAVTAYSGAQLEREGAIDITDVGDTTPNVTLETSRGTNTTLTAFIRGVGQQDPVAGFEQGVGIYLDDVYLNRPQGAVLDIYDVERIEVLRGPQGTLYGRNTIGGAIKYVTRRLPDDPEVRVRANVGTYGQADLIVSGSGSLTDGFRFGASAARLSRNGFGENLTTGDENYNKDIWAVRGTMEMEPSDAIFFRLSGDYTWDDSDARGGHRLIPGLESGAPVLDDEFDTRGGLADPKQKVRGGGIAGHLTWNIADGYSFKSISAWRRSKSHTPIDFDALPSIDVDVPAIYEDSQFSQEVQLEIDRGPLAGIVGAYYLDANAANVFDVRLYTSCPFVPRPGCVIALPGLTAVTQGDVDTKTWAIFGDFTYDITDQWSVSVGGRYTEDKRHAKVFRANYVFGGQPALGGDGGFGTGVQAGAATSNFDGKRKDTAFTPRASISFKPNDDHNIYLSYSRGFKGGGFDPRGQSSNAPGDNANTPPTADQIYDFMAFDPETVNSYELGWKGALFDKRLRMAVALFRANYKDVQVPGSSPCTVLVLGVPTSSFCGITTNAGKARFQGVEVEANWAVAEDLATAGDRLNLSGSLGFLDAEYREFLTVMNLTEDLVPMPATTVDMADFRDVQNTPKWTLSGTVNYDTPLASGRLNVNSTLSYRSKSQQFEIATPGIDENGFALLDASIVWRSAGDHWSIGLHGKNLTDTKYITAGYNFLAQNPYTGEYIGNGAPPGPALGVPGYDAALGREGVLTAFYGNPRQIFLSLGAKF